MMDRGRDAVNGAKNNARDRMNSATGGRGNTVTRSGRKN